MRTKNPLKKDMNLNKWMWKWHFIGGLVSLPIILLLSVTGIIYLFKNDVEQTEFKPMKKVVAKGIPISFQEQLEIAKANAVKKPTKLVLPTEEIQATEFISGKHGGKSTLFIDPYTQEVTGEVVLKDTWMYKIRKLHGELLLGKFGTLFVELVACWMVVLIITGLYIWWPKKKWKLGGFFTIRTNVKKRLMWRDLHAVTSFWIFILLLITLAGGLPWTEVWGDGFKKIQEITDTGYPSTWRSRSIQSNVEGKPLSLDQMVTVANDLKLEGKVSISLPLKKNSVFSVSNRHAQLSKQKVYHFDQYSGDLILKHNWDDVGILMQGRQWAMRFHEGLLASWNWWLMLIMSMLFTLSSVAAIFAYILRKKKGQWGVPKVPVQFTVGKGIIVLIILLGIFFPLFGVSLLLIYIAERYTRNKKVIPISS